MTALIGEITRRLPDRWLAGTLGPGLLWVAGAAVALRLGHSHPFAASPVAALAKDIGELVQKRPAEAIAMGVLLFGAALLVSAVARLIGAGVRVAWWGRWRGPAALVGRWLTGERSKRTTAALARAGTRLPAAYLPATPTWIGDRLRLADARVRAQYGLSLALVWPRVWHLLDADARALVQQARARMDLAGTLAGWAVCTAAPAAVWWPAGGIGLVLYLVAWRRGRSAAAVFAATVESTVDIRHRELASALGYPLADGEPLSHTTADAINDQLDKGATPQPQADSGPTDVTL